MNPWQELAVGGVQNLQPYVPGKPIDDLERELGIRDSIKLASNESPLGPSAHVMQALETAGQNLALYPDGSGHRLKAKLAERLGVESSQITLGNGSNDVLELVARVFLQPGQAAMYSQYAFMVYPIVVEAVGAEAIVAPALNFGHDLGVMAQMLTANTRLVFLANPNNPTGTYFQQDQLCEFLDQVPANTLVVLDEAYCEYVSDPLYPSGIALMPNYPNLMVTRTFSKAYGLAGLRVGYGVSSPDVAELMNRLRQPFNVNTLALVAAEAALDDDDHLARVVKMNAEGLALLSAGMTDMGLEWIPSVGNFITVKVHDSDASGVYQQLLERGVITRPIGGYGLPEYLRITAGTPEQNHRLLDALRECV